MAISNPPINTPVADSQGISDPIWTRWYLSLVAGIKGATSAVWGQITGKISDQKDLQAALDAKLNKSDAPTVPDFVVAESVAGSIDGVNALFSLSKTPITGSLALYCGDLRLTAGTAYTAIGGVITMQPGYIPASEAERPIADYRY